MNEDIETDLNNLRSMFDKLVGREPGDWFAPAGFDPLRSDQIRLNTRTLRPVRLLYIKEIPYTSDNGAPLCRRSWRVKDILEGVQFDEEKENLGDELNEMEVIAWLAREND